MSSESSKKSQQIGKHQFTPSPEVAEKNAPDFPQCVQQYFAESG
jgi:hypothetical protein